MYFQDPYVDLYHGNCLEVIAGLLPESVQTVVTSPPYWGLRKYAGEQTVHFSDGDYAYGLEPSVEMYISHSIEILRGIRRVLRENGIVWWNIGDSYAGSGKGIGSDHGKAVFTDADISKTLCEIPSKNLCLIPFRIAVAAQTDGWYVRSVIVWSKPNPMPESVKDRPTESHEYILMLTKSPRYYFDMEAVREPAQDWGNTRDRSNYRGGTDDPLLKQHGLECMDFSQIGRNIRSVWEITTQPFKGAHFATFPEEIPKRCILASTSEKGNCTKCGKPWVRIVEKERSYQSGSGKAGHKPTGKWDDDQCSGDLMDDIRSGPCVSTITTGWQPSCSCNAGVVPAVVLDTFGGSGTTAQVSKQLGRRSIYIDLSEEYCQMAKKRISAVPLPMVGV